MWDVQEPNGILGSDCSVAKEYWDYCFEVFRIQWVLPLSVYQVLHRWDCRSSKKETLVFGRLVPHAIFGTIWKERNKGIFEGVELPIDRLKFTFIGFLLEWSRSELLAD